MKFTVKIQNLGKITGEPIEVGGLTVLAGPNATGKSFFSKALYSVFNAMNANHALMYIQRLSAPFQQGLWELDVEEKESGTKIPQHDALKSLLKRLERLCTSIRNGKDEFEAVRDAHGEIIEITRNAIAFFREMRPALAKLAEGRSVLFDSDSLSSMDKGVSNLENFVKHPPNEIIFRGFSQVLHGNLVGNFQVRDLTEMKGDHDKDTVIDIKDVGVISVEGRILVSKVSSAGLIRLQRHSRVIYLESPIYWKLRGALNVSRELTPPWHHRNGAAALDVPKHFYDLDVSLGRKYSGDIAFPELLARLTGKDVMSGKILLDNGGLIYVDTSDPSPRKLSLPLTATGTVSLGMLALLIEHRVIDKGTFLFIDEPEANLHPQWQAEMITALFELARGGVNVVIATHSSDIIERLRGLLKEHPDAEGLIAPNHFSQSGVRRGDPDPHRKLGEILKDLTDTYFESYVMRKGSGSE